MSNLGLHLAMRAAGVEVRTTSVGDRYVLEELRSGGVQPRRRTVRTHRAARIVDYRRRHPHRPAADVADGADRRIAGRAGLGDAHPAAGADQRRRLRQGRRPRRVVGSDRIAAGGRRARRHRSNPVAALRDSTVDPGHGRS